MLTLFSPPARLLRDRLCRPARGRGQGEDRRGHAALLLALRKRRGASRVRAAGPQPAGVRVRGGDLPVPHQHAPHPPVRGVGVARGAVEGQAAGRAGPRQPNQGPPRRRRRRHRHLHRAGALRRSAGGAGELGTAAHAVAGELGGIVVHGPLMRCRPSRLCLAPCPQRPKTRCCHPAASLTKPPHPPLPRRAARAQEAQWAWTASIRISLSHVCTLLSH
mmetsp:Transcript_53207/g.140741  ORF Transcript_53207/g.140741 Transcript_53207/m.140741 type:complete len:219 (-) Transcript_53207:32-688(-)